MADERREEERSPGDGPRRGHVAEAGEDPQGSEDVLEKTNERALASGHVLRRVRDREDINNDVVSAARRRKLSRWRANADMIDSCCWSESAVAVVANGTGSYLTGVWLIELFSGEAMARVRLGRLFLLLSHMR